MKYAKNYSEHLFLLRWIELRIVILHIFWKIGANSKKKICVIKPPLKPMWAACPFCSVEFDVIGHLENFEKDAAFIFITMGLMVCN